MTANRAEAAVFFLALFCFFGSKQIGDPDFWWHLRTGQFIAESRSLPEADPFASVGLPDSDSAGRQKVILKGYWLSQLIFYSVYSSLGFSGINLLKAFVYTSIFFLQWLIMRQEKVSGVFTYPLIALAAYVLFSYFPGERPQIFSFLFAILTMSLIEKFKRDGKAPYALPAITAVWANTHPGYFAGAAVIAVYLLGEGLKLAAGATSAMTKERYRMLFFWGAVSLACFGLNPSFSGGVAGLTGAAQSVIRTDISEYMSVFALYSEYRIAGPLVAAGVIVFLSVAAFLLNFKKSDITHVLLVFCWLTGGIFVFRFFAFAVILCIPLLGIYLDRGTAELRERVMSGAARKRFSGAYHTLLAVALIVMLFPLLREGLFLRNDYDTSDFPAGAANFIEKNSIRGDIFNHYNWGGYLIWRLYPQHRVFVDGRGLSDEAYIRHLAVLAGDSGQAFGVGGWSGFLDSMKLNIILIPAIDKFSGDIFPLVFSLMESAEWRLVYFDDSAVIFVKEGELNRKLIQAFNMPKYLVFNTVIAEAERGISMSPGNPKFYVSMALALRGLSREKEAGLYFEKARSMLPRLRDGQGSGH